MAGPLLRVVLDTNVIISAAWGGVPYHVLEAWFAERYVLLISPAVLAEYHATLERLLPGSPAADRFLHALYVKGVAVHPTESLAVIRDDPSDDRFLECALAGRAEVIVSGDRHLLQLNSFRGIRIVSPRTFLDTVLDG